MVLIRDSIDMRSNRIANTKQWSVQKEMRLCGVRGCPYYLFALLVPPSAENPIIWAYFKYLLSPSFCTLPMRSGASSRLFLLSELLLSLSNCMDLQEMMVRDSPLLLDDGRLVLVFGRKCLAS